MINEGRFGDLDILLFASYLLRPRERIEPLDGLAETMTKVHRKCLA